MRMPYTWILGILMLVLSPMPSFVSAQSELWEPWSSKEISSLSDDNTGTVFAFIEQIPDASGTASLQVLPSGDSEETKLAMALSGVDLLAWTSHSQIELDVYLPEGNSLNPNRFFLGLADVTDGFVWKDGVFGQASNSGTGWNRVVFSFAPAMRQIDPDARYSIFLSFFYEDSGGRQNLSEAFYLGEMFLAGAAASETEQDSLFQEEVDFLLGLEDSALLDAVARETFDYFWLEANPENGLIKDRSRPDSPASIAAVGFGLTAITIGVDRGWISYEQGYQRSLTTLRNFANGGVEGNHGFFYHFVDMQTGERVWNSELSSIDSTLLLVGALTAGQYFAGTEVETLANQLYEAMDWQWMMAGRSMVSMGWTPENGFLSATWNHFDESLLLYVLAIGSDSYPAPLEMWAAMQRPVNRAGEYIYLVGEPLFVYQYPLAYLDLRNKEDNFANYFNNASRACERNRQFSIDNAENFASYQNGIWGLSASDGPRGYQAYGASIGRHDGTIAPYASISCLPFTPQAAMESLRAMLGSYGSRVWREYGFVSAINESSDWYSTEHIGIDEGITLLMIANVQDEFVWNLLMQNPNVQASLEAVGFVESTGDYAVTPAYLEAAR